MPFPPLCGLSENPIQCRKRAIQRGTPRYPYGMGITHPYSKGLALSISSTQCVPGPKPMCIHMDPGGGELMLFPPPVRQGNVARRRTAVTAWSHGS